MKYKFRTFFHMLTVLQGLGEELHLLVNWNSSLFSHVYYSSVQSIFLVGQEDTTLLHLSFLLFLCASFEIQLQPKTVCDIWIKFLWSHTFVFFWSLFFLEQTCGKQADWGQNKCRSMMLIDISLLSFWWNLSKRPHFERCIMKWYLKRVVPDLKLGPTGL